MQVVRSLTSLSEYNRSPKAATPNKQHGTTPTPTLSAQLLDDLCSRFITNIPLDRRDNPIVVLYKVEEAYWFYLDFYCAKKKSKKSSAQEYEYMSILEFAYQIFGHVPFLKRHLGTLDKNYQEWRQRKNTTDCYGAILLDSNLEKCVLISPCRVKSHGKKTIPERWLFPKGKISEGEKGEDCAIREVREEIGIDITKMLSKSELIRKKTLHCYTTLYICSGVPLDYKFVPATRFEVEQIGWFDVADLPTSKGDTDAGVFRKFGSRLSTNAFDLIVQFIPDLLDWIQCKRENGSAGAVGSGRSRRQRRKSKTLPNGLLPTDESPLARASPTTEPQPTTGSSVPAGANAQTSGSRKRQKQQRKHKERTPSKVPAAGPVDKQSMVTQPTEGEVEETNEISSQLQHSLQIAAAEGDGSSSSQQSPKPKFSRLGSAFSEVVPTKSGRRRRARSGRRLDDNGDDDDDDDDDDHDDDDDDNDSGGGGGTSSAGANGGAGGEVDGRTRIDQSTESEVPMISSSNWIDQNLNELRYDGWRNFSLDLDAIAASCFPADSTAYTPKQFALFTFYPIDQPSSGPVVHGVHL